MTVEEALRNVIKAWENTKPGNTTRTEIQRWLSEDMTPAIKQARMTLGLPLDTDGKGRSL
jgi:hypothetical protein